MSKYTTEVRYICEYEAGKEKSIGYNGINEVIANAAPKIFSFDFPIFDEAYRPVLTNKILMHYYTREICEETYGLWKLRLNAKMNEIMPYYNKLYESANLVYDPLHDHDYTVDHKGKGNNANTRNDSGNDHNTNRYSDTPQGDLQGMTQINNNLYLTNATLDDGSHDYTITDAGTTTDEYINHMYGKSGSSSYAKLIMEHRKALINVDMMIIDELKPLFMNLW